MKKPPLSIDEHRAIGLELFHLRNRIQTLMIDVANRYHKTSRTSRTAMKACKAMDSLRCQMDWQAGVDLNEQEFTPKLYYPGQIAGTQKGTCNED